MDHTRLRDAGIKATYPRLKILDIFHQHAGEHMSAADLYRSLIADRSNIGLATVYRVITQLEEAGLLKRTQLDAHTTVYEINDKGTTTTWSARIAAGSWNPAIPRCRGWSETSPGAAASRWSPTAWCSTAVADAARRRRPPSRRIRMNRDQFSFTTCPTSPS